MIALDFLSVKIESGCHCEALTGDCHAARKPAARSDILVLEKALWPGIFPLDADPALWQYPTAARAAQIATECVDQELQ